MHSTPDKIWAAVKALEGEVIETRTEHSKNTLVEVQTTGSLRDRAIFAERTETDPTKEYIVAAYELLFLQKRLNRKTDLAWLATPDKQCSSIVFAIVERLARGEIIERKIGGEIVLQIAP